MSNQLAARSLRLPATHACGMQPRVGRALPVRARRGDPAPRLPGARRRVQADQPSEPPPGGESAPGKHTVREPLPDGAGRPPGRLAGLCAPGPPGAAVVQRGDRLAAGNGALSGIHRPAATQARVATRRLRAGRADLQPALLKPSSGRDETAGRHKAWQGLAHYWHTKGAKWTPRVATARG